MTKDMSGAVKAPVESSGVYNSARALALGVGLLLAGGILLALGAGAQPLLAILGLLALALGGVVLVVGVYQFADNFDRAAQALIKGGR